MEWSAEASAAIYSIVITAGLNQRAYMEWLLTELPGDERLCEPGRTDRYLPWSDEVPGSCRLTRKKVDVVEVLLNEPIVSDKVLKGLGSF